MLRSRSARWLLVFAFTALCQAFGTVQAQQAGPPDAKKVAVRINELLGRGRDTSSPPIADDTTYLRRVSLDITGKLPSDEDLRAFAASRNPHKRDRLVEHLLATKAYATNWGRYWRDVLTYHTPASGNYLRWQLFDAWMIEQVRDNRPWRAIVTDLVTATGINDEVAPVNFLTSHFGNPVEIAATTSRVFLGVQLVPSAMMPRPNRGSASSSTSWWRSSAGPRSSSTRT